jgi:hypothetical protein
MMKQSSLNDEKVQNSNSNIRGRLKKFSEDLKETNPDAFKNYEFNINRVDNFISRNNINDTNSDKNKAKKSLPGLYDYGQTNYYINTSRDIDSSKSYPRPVLTHLSKKEPPPEFDKALIDKLLCRGIGRRSKFYKDPRNLPFQWRFHRSRIFLCRGHSHPPRLESSLPEAHVHV